MTSPYFHLAAETFRLQLEGMGSERAPAPAAMRGNPRPANDANPIEPRELPRLFAACEDEAAVEDLIAALSLERLP